MLFEYTTNESASRSIWITTEIFLAPSRIWTHRDRVMQLLKQALYLQATTAGFKAIVKIFQYISFNQCGEMLKIFLNWEY